MEDGRYSPVNKEWASSIVVEASDDEKRRWILETHPAVLDGVISRMRRRAKEKTEVKEVPDRQEERETRKWLTAKVPHEAVIQTNENRSFMRMPLDGQYAGYTYNMFNNRIKQSTRITDIQSDSRGRLSSAFKATPTDILREKNSRQRRLKKPSASGRYKKGHP